MLYGSKTNPLIFLFIFQLSFTEENAMAALAEILGGVVPASGTASSAILGQALKAPFQSFWYSSSPSFLSDIYALNTKIRSKAAYMITQN